MSFKKMVHAVGRKLSKAEDHWSVKAALVLSVLPINHYLHGDGLIEVLMVNGWLSYACPDSETAPVDFRKVMRVALFAVAAQALVMTGDAWEAAQKKQKLDWMDFLERAGQQTLEAQCWKEGTSFSVVGAKSPNTTITIDSIISRSQTTVALSERGPFRNIVETHKAEATINPAPEEGIDGRYLGALITPPRDGAWRPDQALVTTPSGQKVIVKCAP